jgi:hypothetical protein
MSTVGYPTVNQIQGGLLHWSLLQGTKTNVKASELANFVARGKLHLGRSIVVTDAAIGEIHTVASKMINVVD